MQFIPEVYCVLGADGMTITEYMPGIRRSFTFQTAEYVTAALNPSALIGKIIVDNALRRAMEKIRDIINEEYERKCGMGVSRELVDTSWIKDA